MNIVCAICTDLLTPFSDIFHTPCGHIFHYACLNQWLERSQTCPQCRGRTPLNQIQRLYFNFSDNNAIKEDACIMQNKLDNLHVKLTLKDKNAKHLSKKYSALESKTKNLEKKLEAMDTETKKRIQNLKLQADVAMVIADTIRKENDQLKGSMEACRKFTDDIFVYDNGIPNPTQPILSTCQPPLPASQFPAYF